MIKGKHSIVSITMARKAMVLFAVFVFGFNAIAQAPKETIDKYVKENSEKAIDQMITFKIPASVILAQAIFESNCGESYLAKKSNNHFGIKCHTEWGGDTIVKSDDTLNECFRKYNSIDDSYTDHSMFLRSRARYSNLFKLSASDYKGWCFGLKTSGYATYWAYAQELIKVIEENKLYEFDGAVAIEPVNYVNTITENILPNNFSLQHITLEDFVSSEALFIEESDVLIKSLDFIIEDEITEMVENYRYSKPVSHQNNTGLEEITI